MLRIMKLDVAGATYGFTPQDNMKGTKIMPPLNPSNPAANPAKNASNGMITSFLMSHYRSSFQYGYPHTFQCSFSFFSYLPVSSVKATVTIR